MRNLSIILPVAAALAFGAVAHSDSHASDSLASASAAGPPVASMPYPKSLWHAADNQPYSYCGACTDDDACGTGNKCCTGNCTNGLKKCYAVTDCSQAK